MPAPARATRAGLLALTLFSLGHFCVDLYSSALGAFQPLLVDKLHMSLTQAGILGGALVFSGSLLQPAYGFLSDRFHTRMFAVLGPAVAGVFISSLGLASSYGIAALMVLLGGAGIAAFHPQASSRAILGMSSNRARWMAIFVSAGTLGLAVGPTFFSTLVQSVRFERSYWGAIPGVLVAVLLLVCLADTAGPATRAGSFDWQPLRSVWKPLTILYFLVFLRSTVQIVFGQFLPLYLVRERGFSVPHASYALSFYLTSGAIGGFLGGQLADHFGGRRVILISMIGSVPFLTLFFLAHGLASMIGLGLGGVILLFTIPVNVVMAQELVPAQAGTVSALMMGFAWGMAGLIFIPLTGWAGDMFSLHSALFSLVLFPLIGFFLTLRLDTSR